MPQKVIKIPQEIVLPQPVQVQQPQQLVMIHLMTVILVQNQAILALITMVMHCLPVLFIGIAQAMKCAFIVVVHG
jgi:hypothetical protein